LIFKKFYSTYLHVNEGISRKDLKLLTKSAGP